MNILEQLQKDGFRPVFSHYKNFKEYMEYQDDIPVKSSFNDFTTTEDIDVVVNHVHKRYPNANLYLVGFSMGAIMSLRWVGEHKGQSLVKGVVSVSCPVDLSKASPYLSQKKNWLYAFNMTQSLIKLAHLHKDLVEKKGLDIDYSIVKNCKTPVEFDGYFSIKVLGYTDLEEFYRKCTCIHAFKDIDIPCLLILSKDDPTYTLDFYPWKDIESNQNIIAAITPRGAHGHFVTGSSAVRWFRKPMGEFLKAIDSYNTEGMRNTKFNVDVPIRQ